MGIQISPFGFKTLTESVNKMSSVPSFIRNLLFKRESAAATKTIMTDIIVGGQKITPFVKRGDPARVVGNLGKNSVEIEPPNIRLKKFLRPSDLYYDRAPGSPMFVAGGVEGENQIVEARKKKYADEQKDLKDMVDRTIEWLCAKGLSGSYSISQPDLNFSIDFSMPSANKPVLTSTALWSAKATCDP